MSQANPLARLESAHRMLAEARTVDEVKEVRDKAEVARLYARERDLGLEAQNYAAEIKIRAERRLGEMIPEVAPQGGDRRSISRSAHTTLNDLGISRDQSSQYQQVAAVPEPVFERHIAEAKATRAELTTAGVVKLAKQRQQEEDADTADRVFEAAIAVSPGAEDRIKQSRPLPWSEFENLIRILSRQAQIIADRALGLKELLALREQFPESKTPLEACELAGINPLSFELAR